MEINGAAFLTQIEENIVHESVNFAHPRGRENTKRAKSTKYIICVRVCDTRARALVTYMFTFTVLNKVTTHIGVLQQYVFSKNCR